MSRSPHRHATPTIKLTVMARRRLQCLVASDTARSRTRRRALIVLLSADGQSGEQIAATLGVTRRTVTNTRMRWRRGGLRALQEGRHSGRPPRANHAYLRQLFATVTRDPRRLGFAFTRWTAPRLAAYLARETGVHLHPAWLRELLRRHGLVWRRTKRTTRHLANRDEVERMRKRISRLKKGSFDPRPTTICGSAMA